MQPAPQSTQCQIKHARLHGHVAPSELVGKSGEKLCRIRRVAHAMAPEVRKTGSTARAGRQLSAQFSSVSWVHLTFKCLSLSLVRDVTCKVDIYTSQCLLITTNNCQRQRQRGRAHTPGEIEAGIKI